MDGFAYANRTTESIEYTENDFQSEFNGQQEGIGTAVSWARTGKIGEPSQPGKLKPGRFSVLSPRGRLCNPISGLVVYFNFTNSKTKIAQTPTVTGNCAACASRNEPPRGSRKERQNIATAVSIPRTNLLFQVMVVSPRLVGPPALPCNVVWAVADILRRNQLLARSNSNRRVLRRFSPAFSASP